MNTIKSITCTNARCTIPWGLKEAVKTARLELTQTVAGYGQNAPQQRVCFYRDDVAGLVVPMQYVCDKQWVFDDWRSEPHPWTGATFQGQLRENQQSACERALATIQSHSQGTVLHLNTGMGKTVCALWLASQLGYKTLILVHKGFLMTQWTDRIKQFCGKDVKIGYIQGDTYDADADIIIGMIQTFLVRHLCAPPGVGLLIVDEAHHIAAKTFQSIMLACPVKHRLGLSATPVRKDGLDIHLLLGPKTGASPHLQENSSALLNTVTTANRRVTIHTMSYTCEAYRRPPPYTARGDINHAAMLNHVAQNAHRTSTIVKAMVGHSCFVGRDTLILVHRRQHVDSMVDALKQRGVDAAAFVPSTRKKDVPTCPANTVVVSTYMYASEGFDESRFVCLVMASPVSDAEQAVGRVLRTLHSDQTSTPHILDVVDQWSVFNAQAKKRRAMYTQKQFTVRGMVQSHTHGIMFLPEV